MSRWKTVSVDVDVDITEFLDEDIKEEYEDRFGPHGEIDTDVTWIQLYELRRSKPVEEFLKVMDGVIMNRTGRIL